jgi:hypothetical protein
MKQIILGHSKKKEIMKIINVTYPTIRAALKYKSDSTLAFKIRKLALELGGVEMSAEKERVIKL